MLTSIAALIARLLLGTFYLLARFRFFYDPSKAAGHRFLNSARRGSLTHKMCHCGLRKAPTAWAVGVAAVEVLCGAYLIAGWETYWSAFALLCVTLVATKCTAREKVLAQHPVDRLDYVAAYLWRVEGLYIGLALIVLLLGPGVFSLDHLVGVFQ